MVEDSFDFVFLLAHLKSERWRLVVQPIAVVGLQQGHMEDWVDVLESTCRQVQSVCCRSHSLKDGEGS